MNFHLLERVVCFATGQQQARRRGFVKEVIVERKSLLEKLRATGSLPTVLDFKAQRDEVRRTWTHARLTHNACGHTHPRTHAHTCTRTHALDGRATSS
jgi:hypothetical protein